MLQQIWINVRPIIISAFFLVTSSIFVQVIGQLIDPTFYLLANKGLGKIIFTSLVISHVGLLLKSQSQEFMARWKEINIYFLKNSAWLRPFLIAFIIFFVIHFSIIVGLTAGGFMHVNHALHITPQILCGIIFGFFVTFMLAWTEELIFRGTLYPYLAQHLSPLTSIVLTSFIFMLAHNILSPLALLTHDWQLGLGLFLLGLFLNLVFFISDRLYVGMGIHAGLVFVKVILRRIPLFIPRADDSLPWWFSKDLREAHLIHFLFLVFILVLIAMYRKRLCKSD